MTDVPLLLNGMMATGKSSVGRLVAAAAGRDFVDLDARIEARAGLSITEIFARQGEAAFRALERDELERVLEGWRAEHTGAPVIALGGGALVDRPTRLAALERAVVVTLDASPESILARAGDRRSRPLLAGPNPAQRLSELAAQRAAGYAEAHARVATDGLAPRAVAERVRSVWLRSPVAVAAGLSSYAVDVGTDTARAVCLRELGSVSSRLLVTDSVVGPLHADALQRALEAEGLPIPAVAIPAGEQHKTVATMQQIWQAAFDHGLDRKSCLLGLGGGVVTDMTGFAAATWLRGIDWVGVPTTLLAMVDASVGGKTGVDFLAAKNSIGAFWQPRAVACDVSFLATESDRAFGSALSEVVKTALIGDPGLFELLESEAPRVLERDPDLMAVIVKRCVRVKAGVVARDERESGLRATLNLGHTVGHALEAEGGYTRLTHGEAVSLGLVAALKIGRELGATSAELEARVVALLGKLGLPRDLRGEPLEAAAALLGHDKKRAGKQLAFVVARDVGDVGVHPLELGRLVALTRQLA